MSSVAEVSIPLRRSSNSVTGDTVYTHIYTHIFFVIVDKWILSHSTTHLTYQYLILSGFTAQYTVISVLSLVAIQSLQLLHVCVCVCVVSPLIDVINTSINATEPQL